MIIRDFVRDVDLPETADAVIRVTPSGLAEAKIYGKGTLPGTYNHTKLIQEVIDNAPNDDKYYIVLCGSFFINEPIIVRPNVHITGLKRLWYRTKLIAVNNTDAIFTCEYTSYPVNGVTIENLHIDLNWQSNYFIKWEGAEGSDNPCDVLIRGIGVEHPKNEGSESIFIRRIANVELYDIRLAKCGIYLNGGGWNELRQVRIWYDGEVVLGGFENIKITDCILHGVRIINYGRNLVTSRNYWYPSRKDDSHSILYIENDSLEQWNDYGSELCLQDFDDVCLIKSNISNNIGKIGKITFNGSFIYVSINGATISNVYVYDAVKNNIINILFKRCLFSISSIDVESNVIWVGNDNEALIYLDECHAYISGYGRKLYNGWKTKAIFNYGLASFSGDGSTTQFKISHGLVTTPKVVVVTPKGSTPKPDSVDWDSTYIYINYSTAPASGTSLVFSWYVEV